MDTNSQKERHPYRDENGFMRFGTMNHYNAVNQINASVVFMPILQTNRVPEYLDFQKSWADLAKNAASHLVQKFPELVDGVDFEINSGPNYYPIRYNRRTVDAIPLLTTVGNPSDEYHVLSTLGFEMMTGLGMQDFFEQFQNLYPVPWYTSPRKSVISPTEKTGWDASPHLDSDSGFLDDLVYSNVRNMFVDERGNTYPSIEMHKHGLISHIHDKCNVDLLVFRRSITIVEGETE